MLCNRTMQATTWDPHDYQIRGSREQNGRVARSSWCHVRTLVFTPVASAGSDCRHVHIDDIGRITGQLSDEHWKRCDTKTWAWQDTYIDDDDINPMMMKPCMVVDL